MKDKINVFKNKKAIIGIIIFIAIVIIGILIFSIIIPRYHLNKALKYIDNKDYGKACNYININGTDENKKLINDIVINIFIDRQTNCINEVSSIFDGITNLLKKDTEKVKNNESIDYSEDDSYSERIDKLDIYAKDINIFPKNIFPEYFSICYDDYFNIITDVMLYCKNPLDVATGKSDIAFEQYYSTLLKVQKLSSEASEQANKISLEYNFQKIPEKYKVRFNIK